MSKLPRISGRQCIKALTKAGFLSRNGSTEAISSCGGRILLPSLWCQTTKLDRGTLRAIIRQASLSVEAFNELL